MRQLDAAILSQFSTQQGMNARLLMWLTARNRVSGEPEKIGFWTGDDHSQFLIGGETRTYYGAGTLLSTDPIKSEIGIKVRSHRVYFSPIAEEVQLAIRGYDARLAPVEMHVAYFDFGSQLLIAEPERVFRGFVDTVNITTSAVGGESDLEVNLLSSAFSLTKTLARKKSQATLNTRNEADKFRQYTSVTGTVQTIWGEEKAVSP